MTEPDNTLYSRRANPRPGTISSGLLKAVLANDPDAWRRLSALFGPLVYYWCRLRGLQSSDAEDVVQEVFRTVVQRIADFRRDRARSTFRGWLRTITRNKLGDFIRAHRRHIAPQLGGTEDAQFAACGFENADESDVEDDPSAETMLLYRRVLELIRVEFEEQTWEAFWRVVVDGAVPSDVAAELDMSVNSVYLAKSRILRRVRDEFQDVLE